MLNSLSKHAGSHTWILFCAHWCGFIPFPPTGCFSAASVVFRGMNHFKFFEGKPTFIITALLDMQRSGQVKADVDLFSVNIYVWNKGPCCQSGGIIYDPYYYSRLPKTACFLCMEVNVTAAPLSSFQNITSSQWWGQPSTAAGHFCTSHLFISREDNKVMLCAAQRVRN